jgi:UDP-N-acetyl-D-glucosamine dehydrogenase
MSAISSEQSPSRELLRKTGSRYAVAAVMGLGYVGPLLLPAFADAGFRGLGYDVDADYVNRLLRGETEVPSMADRLGTASSHGRGDLSADSECVAGGDCICICVPTPWDGPRE